MMTLEHNPYLRNKIVILRHGQTEWNLEKRAQGYLDSRLTKEGIIQAKKAAEKLQEYNFDLIVSSPLGRALETAKIIAERLNVSEIKINSAFSERGLGILQGHRKSELIKKFPQIWDSNEQFIYNSEVPEGEPFNEFFHRVQGGMKELKDLSKTKSVLVVTHGGVVHVIVNYIKNISVSDAQKFYKHCEPLFL